MEIKIGVRHNTREIVIETSEAQEILTEKVTKAIENGSILEVMDDKGNTTLIPGGQISYVELGSDAKRHVGFVRSGGALRIHEGHMWFRFPPYSPPCASGLEDASLTFQFWRCTYAPAPTAFPL